MHIKTFLLVTTLAMVFTIMSATVSLSQSSKGVKATADVIHQLRIYEIFDGNKKAFHERFRDRAMRIMARYGFKIVATWESRHNNRTELVYLLEWSDREAMKAFPGAIVLVIAKRNGFICAKATYTSSVS